MHVYPAMRARMGDWSYYIVRMTMREVALEVDLASKLWTDETLSEAIQRAVKESRVKHELVKFLSRRPDRFFSSLVVAAIGGNPTWKPVASGFSEDTFGELTFQDDPQYYALDGQHRLTSIKELLADLAGAPQGFANEHISVIVIPRPDPTQERDRLVWVQRYRRLFSSLNRYAKPTDTDTNIIMDEDDVFAIATRALISDHEFFRVPLPQKQSFKVLTSGKNLRSGHQYFTSLQTLYYMNKVLLMGPERKQKFGRPKDLRVFLQFRPDDAEIESYNNQISRIWSALLDAFPVLQRNPVLMRAHDVSEEDPEKYADHLAFWPVGQEVLARVARSLLDFADLDPAGPHDAMVAALRPLVALPWDLHGPPWRNYFLVENPKSGKLRMRNEDRAKVMEGAERLFRWMCGLDPLNEEEEAELKDEWAGLLYPQPAARKITQMWEQVRKRRTAVLDGTTDTAGATDIA